MGHFRFRRSFGNVGTRRFRGARPNGSPLKLLDTYTGTASAYSFALLSSSYTGDLYSDTAGSIATIYDQSGSSNLTQATGANQPTLTADPSASFDGSNDYIFGAATNTDTTGSVYLIFSPDDVVRTNRQVLISFSDTATTNNYIEFGLETDGRVYMESNSGGTLYTVRSISALSNNTYSSLIVAHNSSEYSVIINGEQEPVIEMDGTTQQWVGDVVGGDQITLGATQTSGGVSRYFDGNIHSAVISADQFI